MKKRTDKLTLEHTLVAEVRSLTREIKRLKEMDFMQVFKSPFKFMWFSFLKGLMVGFGSVLGASVLVAIFVYLMSQISLIPIIGDFVEDIVLQVQTGKETSNVNN